jgi:branched-chain amino acid transport system permease protein
VFMALATTTLSPTSFMVIGALVAVALTYLAGVSSLAGALLAAALAQSGIVTTGLNSLGDGQAGEYVFAFAGIGLVVVAVVAPAGLTGLLRDGGARLAHRARRPADASASRSPDDPGGVGPTPLEVMA